MEKITLELQPRETAGKHNAALRRRGVTPAHIFGHGVDSKSLEGQTTEIEQVLSRAGMSHLVDVKIKGEKRPRSVLVREIQRKPGTGLLLHVDLYQVKSTEKMTVEVPVHIVGVSPAVQARLGTLAVELPVLTIDCLPADLPERVDVDVSRLKTASDVLRVSDVRAPEGVTILNARELAVVTVEVERKEEPAVGAAPETAAKSEEKTAT